MPKGGRRAVGIERAEKMKKAGSTHLVPASMKGHEYSDEYREMVFYHWYQSGRTSLNNLEALLSQKHRDEIGAYPDHFLLAKWKDLDGWEARADVLDAQASDVMDIKMVQDRIDMFQRHADIGKELSQMGMNFLRENGIRSDASAIRAIVEGTVIERSSKGMAELLNKISQMDNTQLEIEINKLLDRQEANIIDGEAKDAT